MEIGNHCHQEGRDISAARLQLQLRSASAPNTSAPAISQSGSIWRRNHQRDRDEAATRGHAFVQVCVVRRKCAPPTPARNPASASAWNCISFGRYLLRTPQPDPLRRPRAARAPARRNPGAPKAKRGRNHEARPDVEGSESGRPMRGRPGTSAPTKGRPIKVLALKPKNIGSSAAGNWLARRSITKSKDKIGEQAGETGGDDAGIRSFRRGTRRRRPPPHRSASSPRVEIDDACAFADQFARRGVEERGPRNSGTRQNRRGEGRAHRAPAGLRSPRRNEQDNAIRRLMTA